MQNYSVNTLAVDKKIRHYRITDSCFWPQFDLNFETRCYDSYSILVAHPSFRLAAIFAKLKMLATRNISGGFSRFLTSTTITTAPVARIAPAIAVHEKIAVLKDSKLSYAPPSGKASVTTHLLGKMA